MLTTDQKHIAHARWLKVTKPDNLEVKARDSWHWTPSGQPVVGGGGVSDISRGHSWSKAEAGAETKPRQKRRSKRRTTLDSNGSSRSIKHVQRSTSSSDSDEPTGEPRTPWRNATEMQEGGSISPAGGLWSEHDRKELEKAVPVYSGDYSAIYRAIQSGRIPMDRKDIGQQQIRSILMSQKYRIIRDDGILPPGFNHIEFDRTFRKRVRDKKKNPCRKETEVDSDGQPTNTKWDPTRDPDFSNLSLQGGHCVQPSPTGSSPTGREGVGRQQASMHFSPNSASGFSTPGAHNIQPSPIRPSLTGQESPGQQQDLPAP